MLNRLVAIFQSTFRVIILLALLIPIPVQGQAAVVRAILFYSPSCGHCHYVITEILIPLVEEYGEQLQIIGIDISEPTGSAIFSATIETFNIPLELTGVPFLVVGDQILIGSQDIPDRFPDLVEMHLAQGGLDWPPIPGLAEALAEIESAESEDAEPGVMPDVTAAPELESREPSEQETQAETQDIVQGQPQAESSPPSGAAGLISPESPGPRPLSITDKVALDPVGNGLSILVLIMMLAVVIYQLVIFQHPVHDHLSKGYGYATPVLCLVGLVVAGYLAYVETAQVTAICGPVGDCNTVQQSEYARLFGLLPVGVLGLIGYLSILAAWVVTRIATARMKAFAWLAIFGMTLGGTIFSIYLTFLEPFVIGATCAWCLSSAILITVLFWLSNTYARRALGFLTGSSKKYSHIRYSQRP